MKGLWACRRWSIESINWSMPERKLSAVYLNEGQLYAFLPGHNSMDQVHYGDSVELYSVHTRMNRIALRPVSHNLQRNHALRRECVKAISEATAVFRSSFVLCRLKEVRIFVPQLL